VKSWSSGTGFLSAWFLGLFFAALLLFISLPLPGQSLTAISPLPSAMLPAAEPLWQALLPIATSLPSNYDSFVSTTQQQVQEQIANNELLQASNLSLRTSNSSLTQENAGLRQSLSDSLQAGAISENKSTLLQKALSDSTQSTIQTQADLSKSRADAKALEFQVGLLKVGCVTLGIGCAAAVVYIGGRLIKVW